MIKIIVSVLTIFIVVAAVTVLNNVAPDIPPEALYLITFAFKLAWVANKYVAIDTLFQFATYVIIIETGIWTIRFIDSVRASTVGTSPLLTFGRFRSGHNNPQNPNLLQ